MRYYDRLYGELHFPPIIQELLNCPGLLRLRDVRMANNQFAAFPAFANSSRYEHSLGVCYLAGLCSKNLQLSEKDTIELMIACLYHDVGTPPYAHAMEEVLQGQFGFDHEQNLKSILTGTNDSVEGNWEQVYLDCTIKLRSVCHSKKGQNIGLDIYSPYRIADIIVGNISDPLAPLLCGKGMDLDNIDNIIRASSAMGILDSEDLQLPIKLANAFMFDKDGTVCLDANYIGYVRKWQHIREQQYSAIFSSTDDFAYQTMIKKAIMLLINSPADYRLSRDSWKLTDSEILHEYLLKSPLTREIMERVQLCKPFQCLGTLYIKGPNVSHFINSNISSIESIASEFFMDVLGLDKNDHKVQSLQIPPVVANYYPDKRKRKIFMDTIYLNQKIALYDQDEMHTDAALLGLFTPLCNSNYKNQISPSGKTQRKQVSFRDSSLFSLIDILQNGLFSNYSVTIYGKDSDGKHNTETTYDQLGLF